MIDVTTTRKYSSVECYTSSTFLASLLLCVMLNLSVKVQSYMIKRFHNHIHVHDFVHGVFIAYEI